MPASASAWAVNVARGWQYCLHSSHPFPVSQASKNRSAFSAIELITDCVHFGALTAPKRTQITGAAPDTTVKCCSWAETC